MDGMRWYGWYEIYVLHVLVATGVDMGIYIVHTSDIHVLHVLVLLQLVTRLERVGLDLRSSCSS